MTDQTIQLQLKDIRCQRGDRLLFKNLNFICPKATLVRVGGPNGTGKTSLLRLIVGLMQPTQGQILWGGESITKLKEDFWKDLVYIGHLNGVKDELTVLENLLINCEIGEHAITEEEAISALERVGLAGFENYLVRQLSQGQKRRVTLARLYVASYAKLWVLDEPFVALDVKAVAELANQIVQYVNAGGIVIYTTHQEVPIAVNHSMQIDLSGGVWLRGKNLERSVGC